MLTAPGINRTRHRPEQRAQPLAPARSPPSVAASARAVLVSSARQVLHRLERVREQHQRIVGRYQAAVVGRHLMLDRVSVHLEAELLADVVEVDHEAIPRLDLPEGGLLDHLHILPPAEHARHAVALGALSHHDADPVVCALLGAHCATIASSSRSSAASKSFAWSISTFARAAAKPPAPFGSSAKTGSSASVAARACGSQSAIQPASTSRLAAPCSTSASTKRP